MANHTQNTDSLQRPVSQVEAPAMPVTEEKEAAPKTMQQSPRAGTLHIEKELETLLVDTSAALRNLGFTVNAVELDKMISRARREHFTVAVVGEFNRGKSSFINRLLERNALPVGDLPVTAIITRVHNHHTPVLVCFDAQNRKVVEKPLSLDTWDGLTANNFGDDDFAGSALVGLPCEWLEHTNVELLDTPGASDLSESRMRNLGDALLGCDGVIITIDATQPLSLSEKTFIEERLLTRKLPFMLLIVTKLDRVREKERAIVLDYILQKLESWKMSIPVYVPDKIEVPGSSYSCIIGMDKVKQEVETWVTSPERISLVEQWLLGKTADILTSTLTSLRESQHLLESVSEEERRKLADKKMQLLTDAELVWGDLKLEMQKRCSECYKLLLSKIDDYAASITELLQYEVGHCDTPGQWWQEDFPYRIKIELTNLSVNLDSSILQKIREDALWYRDAIEHSFQSAILFRQSVIAEKNMFGDFKVGNDMDLENPDKKKNLALIGTAVLSISGYALFSAVGFLPIIATMGIGTASTILTEHFYRQMIESQRQIVQKEIARCVPLFIESSLAESEQRLEAVYQDIVMEAEKSEQAWILAQEEAIRTIGQSEPKNEKQQMLREAIRVLSDKLGKIESMMEGEKDGKL